MSILGTENEMSEMGSKIEVEVTKMRTVNQIAHYFKKNDPDTNVNTWMLYNLLRSGQLNHLKIGNKYLIDLDQFIEFLRTGDNITLDNNDNERIRRVD